MATIDNSRQLDSSWSFIDGRWRYSVSVAGGIVNSAQEYSIIAEHNGYSKQIFSVEQFLKGPNIDLVAGDCRVSVSISGMPIGATGKLHVYVNSTDSSLWRSGYPIVVNLTKDGKYVVDGLFEGSVSIDIKSTSFTVSPISRSLDISSGKEYHIDFTVNNSNGASISIVDAAGKSRKGDSYILLYGSEYPITGGGLGGWHTGPIRSNDKGIWRVLLPSNQPVKALIWSYNLPPIQTTLNPFRPLMEIQLGESNGTRNIFFPDNLVNQLAKGAWILPGDWHDNVVWRMYEEGELALSSVRTYQGGIPGVLYDGESSEVAILPRELDCLTIVSHEFGAHVLSIADGQVIFDDSSFGSVVGQLQLGGKNDTSNTMILMAREEDLDNNEDLEGSGILRRYRLQLVGLLNFQLLVSLTQSS